MNADAVIVQGWFTLAAAGIAAIAAVIAAVLVYRTGLGARESARRDQWWTRFSWSLEKAVSGRAEESELGLAVLSALLDAQWALREDNEMAAAVARQIARGTPQTEES